MWGIAWKSRALGVRELLDLVKAAESSRSVEGKDNEKKYFKSKGSPATFIT